MSAFAIRPTTVPKPIQTRTVVVHCCALSRNCSMFGILFRERILIRYRPRRAETSLFLGPRAAVAWRFYWGGVGVGRALHLPQLLSGARQDGADAIHRDLQCGADLLVGPLFQIVEADDFALLAG